MELLFRPFDPEDMDALFFLHQRCHGDAEPVPYGQLVSTLLQPETSAVVAGEADADRGTRLVAAMVLRPDTPAGRLRVLALMVDPPLRRRGIARKLLAWAERLGRGRFAELAVGLEADLPAARAFLEAGGFRQAGTTTAALRPGDEAVPCWVRPLDAPAGGAAEPGGDGGSGAPDGEESA